MPASRSAAATTLAPRSWPSSPGLATSTRIGRGGVLLPGWAVAVAFMADGNLGGVLRGYKPAAEGRDVGRRQAAAAPVPAQWIEQHRDHPDVARPDDVHRVDVADVVRLLGGDARLLQRQAEDPRV